MAQSTHRLRNQREYLFYISIISPTRLTLYTEAISAINSTLKFIFKRNLPISQESLKSLNRWATQSGKRYFALNGRALDALIVSTTRSVS